jgi:hypothetical protein
MQQKLQITMAKPSDGKIGDSGRKAKRMNNS